MSTIVVNGVRLAYELHGEGDPVVITPGGRMGMDTAGIRELALALAGGGKRVLVWDRPNCGASDICLDGELEWRMQADMMAGLIGELELGPATFVGGSSGAVPSILAAIHQPEVVHKLAILWMPGNLFHCAFMALGYYGAYWSAAKRGGMQAVVDLPENPVTLGNNGQNQANRERLLAMDPDEFADRMGVWGAASLSYIDTPVQGAQAEELTTITAPTMIFRGAASDPNHPRRNSEWMHELIPGSRLVEPPWGETEWDDRVAEFERTGENVFFVGWPQLAPQLLAFINEPAAT